MRQASQKNAMISQAMEQNELAGFQTLIEQRSGICFDSSRDRFFRSRLREHLAAKGLESEADLMPLVRSSNVEYEMLLERLLTHETSFFRYPSAFEALRRIVLPSVQARKALTSPRTLRLWSAGCSTGEEAYSMAIALAESGFFSGGWNVEILATDISRPAIAQALRGRYPKRAAASLSPEQIAAYFTSRCDPLEVKPAMRDKVSFVVMNLVQSLYLGRMDSIFCMNVLIYFSEERREQILRTFYQALEPGGFLMLGHSDTLGKVPVKFERIVFDDFMLYRKPEASDGALFASSSEGGPSAHANHRESNGRSQG